MRIRVLLSLSLSLTSAVFAQGHLPKASPFPIDFDGDGISSFADRVAFQLWVEGGGDQNEALLSAAIEVGPEGNVLDVSDYLEGLLKDKAEEVSQAHQPEPIGGQPEQAQAGAGCGADTSVTILDSGPVANFPLVQSVRVWKGNAGAPPDQMIGGQPVNWTANAYNDTVQGWTLATHTPIGKPEASVQFFLDDTPSKYVTFYVRTKFTLPSTLTAGFDPSVHGTLEADLGVNDGFVAFLNGREIRRANVAGSFLGPLPGPSSLATQTNEVTTRLSGYADMHAAAPAPYFTQALVSTTNVLAVHVLNRSLLNSTCIYSPRILARKRGPFIARASAQSGSGPAATQSTAFEVCVRTSANPEVTYKVGTDPTEFFSNQVIRDSEFDGETIARIQVPGAFDGVPNPVLPAATPITYEVLIPNGGSFEDNTFAYTTAGPFNEPFSFWAFGNSGLVGTFGNKPGVGDPGGIQALLAGVMESVADPPGAKSALVMSAGDLVIRNNDYPTATSYAKKDIEPALNVEAVDHRVYNPYACTLARLPLYAAAGDEDLEFVEWQDPPTTIELDWDFTASYVLPEGPHTPEANGLTEHWYSFDHGLAHFTVIRSSSYHDRTMEMAGQLSISEMVAFVARDVACSNKLWKIVVVHHPPYTSSARDADVLNGPDDEEFRTALETSFGGLDCLGIDLVINAHHPWYEQTHAVMRNAAGVVVVTQGAPQAPHFLDPGAPVYVVTGGGGENLWQNVPSPQDGFTMVLAKQHHVTRITVNENVLTIQPFNEAGTPIDIDAAGGGTSSTITKSVLPLPTVRFRRGDSNSDNTVNLSDPVFTLAHLFQGGPQPRCLDAADANDDGSINLTDNVITLAFLFQGGPPPAAPGPQGCGTDPTTADVLTCLDAPVCTECDCADFADNDGDDLVDGADASDCPAVIVPCP